MDTILTAAERVKRLLPPEVQKQWAEEDLKQAKLIEAERQALCLVLEEVAQAMSYPRISRAYLEEAHKQLSKAMSIAAVIDPEEV